MGIFGENWKDHDEKIRSNWEKIVRDEDIVLIPGDISWAINLEDAAVDLKWIADLPGRKVLIKGNHDFWWKSISKVRNILPQGMYALQNNSIMFNEIAIAGTRWWENDEINFSDYIEWIALDELLEENANKNQNEENFEASANIVNGKTVEVKSPRKIDNPYNAKDFSQVDFRESQPDSEKIRQREIHRLVLSLKSVPSRAKRIIVMLHYPPVDFSFRMNEVVEILMDYGVDTCIFGHLHSLKRVSIPKFPINKWGIDFHLVSSDFVDFVPQLII